MGKRDILDLEYLPLDVSKIADIDERGESLNFPNRYYGIPGGDHCVTLANFNDNGLSFKRIANLIEKYL